MQKAILTGQFYEKIGECWKYKKLDVKNNLMIRKEVKEKVFKHLLFKKNINLNSYVFKIKNIFPDFIQSLSKISSKYDSFANELQKLEAKIMLPVIQEQNGVGVHDGVIFNSINNNPEEYEKIENLIKTKTKTCYGVQPSFSRTQLSNISKKQLVTYFNNQNKENKLNNFLNTLTTEQIKIIKNNPVNVLKTESIIKKLRNQTVSYLLNKIIKSDIDPKIIGYQYIHFYNVFQLFNDEKIIRQRNNFKIKTRKQISILNFILQEKKMKKELINTLFNHKYYCKKLQVTWSILKYQIRKRK